jgi:small subunit ribosomal protein S6
LNKYEGIFIFKPDLPEKDLEAEYAKAEEIIKKHEGKSEKSEKWGKKRLTFTIKKFKDGFFLYIAFEAPPDSIKVLTELFKLNNSILRVQITRKDK